jgi:anthranilate phosphoribosyltransferase
MSKFRIFRPPARRTTGMAPGTRNILTAAAICLAALGLVMAFGQFMGPPTNRAMADALAAGG